MFGKLWLVAVIAVVGLFMFTSPSRADVSGTCWINSCSTGGCGGNVCSVVINGSALSPNCPFIGYHWDRNVTILYYHAGTGQWEFCGMAAIPGTVFGCTFPINGQTSVLFYKGQTYQFKLVATIDHNDGTPAVLCVSAPFSYTVLGS